MRKLLSILLLSLLAAYSVQAAGLDLLNRHGGGIKVAMGSAIDRQDPLTPDAQDEAPDAGMTLAPKGVPKNMVPKPPLDEPITPPVAQPPPSGPAKASPQSVPASPQPPPGGKAGARGKKVVTPTPLPELARHGLLGTDVSQYQATIDWPKLATERKFVFIRASYGDELDPAFPVNWKAARATGVIRGAYHFFNPQKSLRLQIRRFVQAVGRLEKGDLPPVIDLEDYRYHKLWPRVLKEHRVSLVMRWLKAVEQALGVKPIIYLSPAFVRDTLGLEFAKPLMDYDLWVAHHDVPQPVVPQPWNRLAVWQYTIATCAGVIGLCDQDTFPGTLSDLVAKTVQHVMNVQEIQDPPEETLLPVWQPRHRHGPGRWAPGHHHGFRFVHGTSRGHRGHAPWRGGGHCRHGHCR